MYTVNTDIKAKYKVSLKVSKIVVPAQTPTSDIGEFHGLSAIVIRLTRSNISVAS